MDTVTAEVGNTFVAIETTEVEATIPSGAGNRYGTRQTGAADEVRDAYAQLKVLLQDIADDLGTSMTNRSAHWPESIELSFGLSLSASGGIWVMKASGEITCNVTMKWSSGEGHADGRSG